MDIYNKRLQVLKWLFDAIRHWLMAGQVAAQISPGENDTSDLNWDILSKMAYFHNMEQILHRTVSNNDFPRDCPEWLKQRWEKTYFGNFLRNEEYFDVLKTLLGRCREESISVIVLKGPALIGRIYKDSALRTMSDLDILCSPDDLPRIVKTGRHMGYLIMEDEEDPASTHHVAMYRPDSGTVLEFHFMPYGVIQHHPRFMRLAWDRKEWIGVGDFHCPVLCIEMELLFNIAHLVQHQFDLPLKHYLDIAGLLVSCREQLNLSEAGALLRDFGLEQAFILTALFLSTMMRLPHISKGPWLNKKDTVQQKFNTSLRDLLALLDEERLLDVRGVIWSFSIVIKNREGLGNRMAHLVKALFPFPGGLAECYGINASGNAFRYLLRRLIFYGRRLFLTFTHISIELLSKKRHSLAVERAWAKDRITRQLLRIARPRRP